MIFPASNIVTSDLRLSPGEVDKETGDQFMVRSREALVLRRHSTPTNQIADLVQVHLRHRVTVSLDVYTGNLRDTSRD